MFFVIIANLLLLYSTSSSCQTTPDHVLSPVASSDDTQTEWDYEPRVWSPDEVQTEFMHEYHDTEDQENIQAIDNSPSSHQSSPAEHVRRQSNFLSQNINLKPIHSVRSEEDFCTQFRLDTREAVVCDKKRCDKFDFEWPTYDNQIAWVQTTKHGMRFHRADLAFAPKASKRKSLPKVDERGKVPFDLFDFFKPKPTSTEPPSSTTTTKAPKTSTSAAPTTIAPSQSPDDSTESPATTTTGADDAPMPIPVLSTTGKPAKSRDVADTSQDLNTTQLITTFRLDTGRLMQKMIGFGGALSDSTCRNIKSLSPQMARSLMDDYFGDRGLRYNIARLSIGSSDFSTTPYTNNDQNQRRYPQPLLKMAADEMGDVEMKNFRLTDEDYEFKLPIARQAIATSKQELKFFASMWSPPIWMKNNSHIVHGYLKGDVYGPYYKGMAELMVKWLEAYRKNGVEFWGMTGLNEPVTGVKPFIFHNSLGITKEDYVTFFKLYLGPMLRQRGFQNVKIIILDDNKGYLPNWANFMLSDPEAAKYVSGVGIHWYMNDEYENMNFLSKRYPDKFIISTEACNGFLPFQIHALPGNWDRGVAYMYDMLKTIQKNSAAWVDWNMALDLTGGPSWAKNNLDAAIIVNARRDEYYKSPMFYALGHFSRFVEPNATRLDYRIANAKFDYPVEAVGFLNTKNYIIIVAMNSNRHQVPFKVIVDKQVVRIINLRAESFNTIIFKWKPKS